jgi:hypothetical protein
MWLHYRRLRNPRTPFPVDVRLCARVIDVDADRRPSDALAEGCALLAVDIPLQRLRSYKLAGRHKLDRKWLVPAHILNQYRRRHLSARLVVRLKIHLRLRVLEQQQDALEGRALERHAPEQQLDTLEWRDLNRRFDTLERRVKTLKGRMHFP